VHIGAGGLSVFSIASAPVPALPVLAAVPAGPAAVWWPVLLLAPAAVGVLAGMECARESGDQARRPWATLSAAGLTALAMLVAGGIAGGTVGSFGDIGPGMFTFAGLTLLWLAIPGYVGLLCTRWFLPAPVGGRRVGEYSDNVDEYDDDYDRDYAEDEYAEDEYDDEYDYADDEYADTDEGYDDDYADPDRPYADDDYGYDDYDPHNASDPATIDGELVEEQPALGTRHRVGGRANETDDILDAEVVETDPQGRGEAEGR
jgi:hypothetical protein